MKSELLIILLLSYFPGKDFFQLFFLLHLFAESKLSTILYARLCSITYISDRNLVLKRKVNKIT